MGPPGKKLGKLKDIHAILILSSPPFMGFSPRNFLEGAAIFWGGVFSESGTAIKISFLMTHGNVKYGRVQSGNPFPVQRSL